MPPKVSKKTEQKKKEKIIEDKTFGLKNKNKSKSVQRYIQSVAANVQNTGTKQAKAEVRRPFACDAFGGGFVVSLGRIWFG
jgi:hypothetical protein